MESDKSSGCHRRVCQTVLLTALLALFGTGLPKLWAGANQWTSIGPFGGSIGHLAIDPQNPETLYGGTYSGLFKSTDGGSSWKMANSAIAVISLAIDPRTPNTLYAGSSGVFKSIDGGLNWSPARSGLPQMSFLPNLQDGPYADVRDLAIDPQNPRTLYAGTQRGLFKSVDGGDSWNAAGAGLPTLPSGRGPFGAPIVLNVDRIVIDPQNTNTLYAIANSPSEVGGRIVCCSAQVFKTTDGGATWNVLTLPVGQFNGQPMSILNLVMDPQNPRTLYAEQFGPIVGVNFHPVLFKSTDGGASWFLANLTVTSSFPFDLAIDPQASNTLYAWTSSGVLKSTDGGTIWSAASSGLPESGGKLVVDPKHSGIVYAISAAGSGLFKTTDGGKNWIPANSGLSTLWVTTLAIDPHNGSSIYAGTGWQGTVFGINMDAGSNWAPINSQTPNFYPFVLATDPQDSMTLYAGTNAGDFGPAGAIFKSTDGGHSWATATSGLPTPLWGVNALAIDPKNPKTIYAAVDQSVFRSSDGGESWNPANFGLGATYISSFAIDPRTPTTVYAGGSDGVFKSTNSGAEWNAVAFPTNAATILAIDPQNPNTIYGGGYAGLFKSTDAGRSWSAASSGLPRNPNWMTALVIDPQNPSTIYLATNGEGVDSCSIPCSGFNDGVFASTDAGASWAALNAGLTTTHVSTLVIDPQNPNRLYAGTQGGGVFAITFGPAPVVTDFHFDPAIVVAGSSFSATVSGSNLTPRTFFDVSFRAPGSSASVVALNWQQGPVASHDLPAGLAAGTWTINSVRAHEVKADHTDSFVPISATLTVFH